MVRMASTAFLPTYKGLDAWYEPHIRKWSERSTPQTTQFVDIAQGDIFLSTFNHANIGTMQSSLVGQTFL
jgi:hypothetical protein